MFIPFTQCHCGWHWHPATTSHFHTVTVSAGVYIFMVEQTNNCHHLLPGSQQSRSRLTFIDDKSMRQCQYLPLLYYVSLSSVLMIRLMILHHSHYHHLLHSPRRLSHHKVSRCHRNCVWVLTLDAASQLTTGSVSQLFMNVTHFGAKHSFSVTRSASQIKPDLMSDVGPGPPRLYWNIQCSQ